MQIQTRERIHTGNSVAKRNWTFTAPITTINRTIYNTRGCKRNQKPTITETCRPRPVETRTSKKEFEYYQDYTNEHLQHLLCEQEDSKTMERICVDTIAEAWRKQQSQRFNKYQELERDRSIRYAVQSVHDVDQEQIAAMDVRNRKIVDTAKRWKSAKGTARTCVLFQDGNRRF